MPNNKSVPAQWVSPGISFENPDVVATATYAKSRPWFIENSLTAMVPIPKKGPLLDIQKPKWRRMYKNRNLVLLDRSYRELPTFDELDFGALHGLNETPISERGMWGNLESVLMTAGSLWQQKENLKSQQKIAEEQLKLQALLPVELSTTAMVGLAVAAGVFGYFMLSRR